MKQLLSSSIAAPGFYGLNTQESSITLSSGFALKADNCVIDQYGRLGARKGYAYQTTSGGTGSNIRGIHEFVGSTGYVDTISWGNNNIYSGTSTLTPLVTGITITDDRWSAATLNGVVYLTQAGHPMLAIDSALNVTTHSATQYSFVTSAYGKLWAGGATNNHTVYGTNLLGSFSGGLDLDLREVWTNGGDAIVSVEGFNGRLIVICKKSIVILGDNDDTDLGISPVNLRVLDVLENVGCVAKASIQAVGDDLFFLSQTGLRSLNRVIQEKSNPLTDLSTNVRDELVQVINSSTNDYITSVYSPTDAFYLLIFPATNLVYCFDTRGRLENGGLRVTKWTNSPILCGTHINSSLCLGLANGIAKYSTYTDDSSSYFLSYHTNYFDFDQPTVNKILKTVGITLIGGSGQTFVVKVGTDYTDTPRSYIRNVKQSSVSEYAHPDALIFETWGPAVGGETYDSGDPSVTTTVAGTAMYTGGGSTDRIKVAVGGSGSVLQLGFEADIAGDQLSIQKFDVYVKQGRTN